MAVSTEIVVYSEGDRRSAELIAEKKTVVLKEISPDVDPEAEPLDLPLNHNILVGLMEANPYVKKYFPNLKANYDEKTIYGYPEVSADGKYIVKTITGFVGVIPYVITVVGGFAEVDTYKATNVFLGIAPPTAKKQGYFIGQVLKLDLSLSDADFAKVIRDELNKKGKEYGVYVGDVSLTNMGLLKAPLPFLVYQFRCDVYEGASPIAPLIIIAILAIVGLTLFVVERVACYIMWMKYYEAQKEVAAATAEKEKVVGSLADALEKEEYCTDKYHDLKTLIEKIQAEEIPTVTAPPTDWMTMLTSMIPLFLVFALIGMLPRGRRED